MQPMFSSDTTQLVTHRPTRGYLPSRRAGDAETGAEHTQPPTTPPHFGGTGGTSSNRESSIMLDMCISQSAKNRETNPRRRWRSQYANSKKNREVTSTSTTSKSRRQKVDFEERTSIDFLESVNLLEWLRRDPPCSRSKGQRSETAHSH